MVFSSVDRNRSLLFPYLNQLRPRLSHLFPYLHLLADASTFFSRPVPSVPFLYSPVIPLRHSPIMASGMTEKVVPTVVPYSASQSPTQSSHDDKEKAEIAPGLVDTVIEGAVTKDGLKVHPQPTTDPLDPLNWSRWRKGCILSIVMLK